MLGHQRREYSVTSEPSSFFPFLLVLTLIIIGGISFLSSYLSRPVSTQLPSTPMDQAVEQSMSQQNILLGIEQESGVDMLEMSKGGKQNLKGSFAERMQNEAIANGKDICTYLAEQRLAASTVGDNQVVQAIVRLEKAFECRNMQKRQER